MAGVPLLVAILGACGGAGGAPEPEPPAAIKPRPLLVLGIDGATWDLIDPMIERGELPNLEQLVRRGVRGDLVSQPPLSSPPLWTTMATGRFVRQHQVYDHTFPFVPGGQRRRVRSTERRVPALWNVASEASRRVAVIGYFATHPPEVVNGVMVSDQAARGAPGGIYPAEVAAELQAELERLQDPEEIRRLQQRYLHWPYDITAIHRPDDPYHRVTQVVKGRIGKQVVWEEFLRRAALHLAPQPFDLFMVYLRMPDHASHSTWLYFEPSAFEELPDPFDRDLLKEIIPAAYRDTDEYLGQLLDRLGPEANVVVVSDHGFGPAVGQWQSHRKQMRMLSGSHRPDGIFLAAGPDIRPGEVDGFTVMDVAPTLLALLGLPVSKELPGRVVTEVLRPAFLADFPLETTPAYRMRWRAVEGAGAPPADTERADLEILAALGYVDAGATPAGADDAEEVDFWAIEDRLRWNAIIGEVLFYLQRDDRQSIRDVMSLVEVKDPQWRRHLPRNIRHRYQLWRERFDFPWISDATWHWFETTYIAGGTRP